MQPKIWGSQLKIKKSELIKIIQEAILLEQGVTPEQEEAAENIVKDAIGKIDPAKLSNDIKIGGEQFMQLLAKKFGDALNLVNDHEFGNGVSIFTRDGDAGRTFSNKAKIGMVGINIPIPVPMAFHSFGGWKRSLFGDSAMHGMEGIKFYTKLKTVTSRWPSGVRSNAEFVMPTMK